MFQGTSLYPPSWLTQPLSNAFLPALYTTAAPPFPDSTISASAVIGDAILASRFSHTSRTRSQARTSFSSERGRYSFNFCFRVWSSRTSAASPLKSWGFRIQGFRTSGLGSGVYAVSKVWCPRFMVQSPRFSEAPLLLEIWCCVRGLGSGI